MKDRTEYEKKFKERVDTEFQSLLASWDAKARNHSSTDENIEQEIMTQDELDHLKRDFRLLAIQFISAFNPLPTTTELAEK